MLTAETGGPSAVDRTLRKSAPEASSRKGYDVDARAIAKQEPLLVESAFLPDGKQVCIWSDGECFLVDKDTGDSPIGIRKARNLISKARSTMSDDPDEVEAR